MTSRLPFLVIYLLYKSVMKVCERGTFSVKMVYRKVKGLDLGAEPTRITQNRVPFPLLRGQNSQGTCKRKVG